MIAALFSLIKSLELFLSLKNKSFIYEIREKSRLRQKQIIESIERLRAVGDSNSSDRADILRQELDAERREFEYLSTLYSASGEKQASPNP
jgi:hypothetical protein